MREETQLVLEAVRQEAVRQDGRAPQYAEWGLDGGYAARACGGAARLAGGAASQGRRLPAASRTKSSGRKDGSGAVAASSRNTQKDGGTRTDGARKNSARAENSGNKKEPPLQERKGCASHSPFSRRCWEPTEPPLIAPPPRRPALQQPEETAAPLQRE
eukprot:COSAG02_NODE_38_length_48090_cov_107.207060_31_plen_159_part_00